MLFLLPLLATYFARVNTTYPEIAYCPQQQDCTWTYPYYTTQNLKCVGDSQCPVGFLCCPDCHYQHSVCKPALWVIRPENLKIQCPESTTIYCKKRFPFLGTQKFQCESNKQCDYGFLCCSDDCYAHKVCKRGVKIEEAEDDCPKDFGTCSKPLPYKKTKYFECTKHVQCPRDDVCCSDGCYTHKICKPNRKKPSNCPKSIKESSCPNTNRTLSKYACASQDDCVFSYICCEDNCFDHKVCKLPNEAFSYQKAHTPESFTLASFDEQYMCPRVEEKCTKPYSIRLAKKFICFKDDDCKIGQLCCKDSCVKDFKICKNIFTLKPEVHHTKVGEKLIKTLESPPWKEFEVFLNSQDSLLTTSSELETTEPTTENLLTVPNLNDSTLSSIDYFNWSISERLETTTNSEMEKLVTVLTFDDSTFEASSFSDGFSSVKKGKITWKVKTTVLPDKEQYNEQKIENITSSLKFDDSSLTKISLNSSKTFYETKIAIEDAPTTSYHDNTNTTVAENLSAKIKSETSSDFLTPFSALSESSLVTFTPFSTLTDKLQRSTNALDNPKPHDEIQRKASTIQSNSTENIRAKVLKNGELIFKNHTNQIELEKSESKEFYFDLDNQPKNEATDHGSGSGDGFQDQED